MELFKYTRYLIPAILGFAFFVIVYLNLLKRRERIFASIFDPEIISQIIPPFLSERRKIKEIIFLIGIFFMVIAVLGPQWGIEYREKPTYSANIAFVIDTSLSMSSKDIKPTRLENVKIVLKSIVEKIKGYRITLIAFQDKAYIQCPLTDDEQAILYFLDILKPDMLPFPGTNIADAILTSYEYLSLYSGEKIVILFTDGEDHSQKVSDAISKISKGNIKFITVGIGTPEGDIVYDEDKKEPKKDPSGKVVISKLDEKTLIEIANRTYGKYIRYTSPENVSSDIIKFIEKRDIGKNSEKSKYYKNRYQYFLIIAFLLILVEFIIMDIPAKMLILFAAAGLFLNPSDLYSFDIKSEFIANKANRFYKNKEYERSLDIYKKALENDSKNEKIKFNMANTFYKMEKYDDAISIYQSLKDKKIISKSHYNTANSYVMKNDLENAIKYYRKAIMEDPSNEDAKYNLEIILKRKNSASSSSNSSSSNSNSGNKNDQQDKNQNNNSDSQRDQKVQKDKQEPQSSQNKQQIEKFLEMIKNMEKESIKKASEKTNRGGEIKNEFDW